MKSFKEVDRWETIRFRNGKGQLHREDGPAVIWKDGDVSYYLNGELCSVKEWEEEIIKRKLERIKDL